MNLQNVIGLNGVESGSLYDDGVYISPEDIDFAQSFTDEFRNKYTVIYTKAGNKVKVLGQAYHILKIEEAKQ